MRKSVFSDEYKAAVVLAEMDLMACFIDLLLADYLLEDVPNEISHNSHEKSYNYEGVP